MDASLTIGKLAESAGVNIETLRYYQRRGLLDAPPKPYTGYRRYDQRHVTRIRFIKRAQTLGFTLSEVAELITLDGGTGADRLTAPILNVATAPPAAPIHTLPLCDIHPTKGRE